jgi:hypothetical protein
MGRYEWENVTIIGGLSMRMFKTPMKTKFVSKVIYFQETLEYQNPISICDG